MAVKVLIMQSRVCNAMHAVSIYVAASPRVCPFEFSETESASGSMAVARFVTGKGRNRMLRGEFRLDSRKL